MPVVDDWWNHNTDPIGIVPNGHVCPKNGYTVLGFCSPSGIEPHRLMVAIRHADGSETTMDYLHVLHAFMCGMDVDQVQRLMWQLRGHSMS